MDPAALIVQVRPHWGGAASLVSERPIEEEITPKQADGLTDSESWFRFHMPYSLVKLIHPRLKHVWLPLNRNYKPLGVVEPDHVDYQLSIGQAMAFKKSPHDLTGVWTANNDEHLYLYDDTQESRIDYFARLERLLCRPHGLVAAADAKRHDLRAWSISGRQARFLPRDRHPPDLAGVATSATGAQSSRPAAKAPRPKARLRVGISCNEQARQLTQSKRVVLFPSRHSPATATSALNAQCEACGR